MRKLVKVGTSGFAMPKAKLSAIFPIVEVQQTFYQPPRISTLEKWRTEVPADFEFTIKAWQLITHESRSPTYRRLKRALTDTEKASSGGFRPSEIVMEAWEVTAACANALGAKRVLFQCPASFGPSGENIENLHRFFSMIDRKDLIMLWETRGPAWSDAVVRSICEELGLVHVVDPFVRQTMTPEDVYYRLHGRGGYRYVYEDTELRDLAEMLPEGRESRVLFNNVFMLPDAQRFLKVLETFA